MAAAYDAASKSLVGLGVTSRTWSHTCTGTELCLVAGASFYDNTMSVSSATYAAAALTSVGSASRVGARAEMWRRIAPATGANNVVMNFAAAGDVVCGAHSATGADQTTPLGTLATATGSSTAVTVTVTAAVDDLVVDVVGTDSDATSWVVGAGQTSRWTQAGANPGSAGSSEPGAASVTMSWTTGAAVAWAICGVAFKAAAAGGAAPPQRTLMGVGT